MAHRSLLSLPFLLLLAGTAQAGALFITPRVAPPNNGAVICNVVNGDREKTIEFVRQIFTANGNAVVNPTGAPSTLGPLQASAAVTIDDAAAFCTVNLVKGPRARVRVSITVNDAFANPLVSLEGRP